MLIFIKLSYFELLQRRAPHNRRDTKAEGYVSGVGSKIFSIAGPVILFGVLSSAVYGVIYYLVTAVMK